MDELLFVMYKKLSLCIMSNTSRDHLGLSMKEVRIALNLPAAPNRWNSELSNAIGTRLGR
jgi:hypothetical protein